MNYLKSAGLLIVGCSLAHGAACVNAPLSTYVNNGNFFSCTEGNGALTVQFNQSILPSWAALSLLSGNNSSVDPANINVVVGNLGLAFDSNDFVENTGLLSSQAELVQFFLDGGSNSISDVLLSFDSLSVAANGLGTGLAIGQELLCLGGSFTTLPTGLVTSVANGVLGTGNFGCSGIVLVGTAAVSSGPLGVITSLLALPNLSGVSDHADILLGSYNATQVDVIKMQALVSVTGGSASDDGFANSYTLATPEPGSATFLLCGCLLFGMAAILRRRTASPVRD